MKELLGSLTKAEILRYLGLRGGCSGRRLARLLGKSPTPVFKALKHLSSAAIVTKHGPPYFYALNAHYRYYEELLQIIDKSAQQNPPKYLPEIPPARQIDPVAVYKILGMMERPVSGHKLSDVLRERYG